MIKKGFIVAVLTLFTINGFAYDAKKAKEFNKFFSKLTQEACAKSKLHISAKETMELIKADKNYLILDVRSEGEFSVMGVRLEKSLHIPIDKLFLKNELDKLPKDRRIIVACHSGTRGLMAVTALKQMGFANTQVLDGGLVALADANRPETAPMK